ncbi:DUF6879 family protein [Salinactinospora qingdaonensis]|uniref:DUF6879 family protein n=1 Tax=Salinactinospora qingdaonensis TaxID=702744 RepID=UPI0031F0E64D
MKGEPIGWDDVEQLFAEFRHTAFRLETRQHYDTASEREPFQQFLATGHIAHSPVLDQWQNEIRNGITRGRSYTRVHIVTEPLSDYVRFECAWAYRPNTTAGENIRILAVDHGTWPKDLPHLDYWLFDSQRLLLMHYTHTGALHSTELVNDPHALTAARTWRDHAIHHATPYTTFETRFDTSMQPRPQPPASRR